MMDVGTLLFVRDVKTGRVLGKKSVEIVCSLVEPLATSWG